MSSLRKELTERHPRLKTTVEESATNLSHFLEHYSRIHKPVNCSQTRSKRLLDRQQLTVADPSVQDFSALERSVLEKLEMEEAHRCRIAMDVDRERRRKVQRLLETNRKENIRALVSSSLYIP